MPHVQPFKRQVADHRIDVHPDVRLITAHGGRALGPAFPRQPGIKPRRDRRARLGRVEAEAQAAAYILDGGKLAAAGRGPEDEIANELPGSSIGPA